MRINMSSSALTSTSVSPQAPLDPKAGWITPQELLKRLLLPIAERVSDPDTTPLFLDLAKLVAEYAIDKWLTNWYTAYDRLQALPKKLPPLSVERIYKIMYSECPIYSDQVKADGEFYKIKDTHLFSLVSEELGSLNRMEKDVLKPYGKLAYSKEENPLRFEFFLHLARQKYADVPFSDTHFILITMKELPESTNKAWDQQVALIDALRQKTLVDYEIPTLQQRFTAITTDMVATTGKEHYQNIYPVMRVKEIMRGYHLVVGFSSSGSCVHRDNNFNSARIGVAAVWKL